MTYNLYGKVAIVTGASRGIGEAIAKEFFNLGAQVVMDCRDVSEGMNARKKIDPRGERSILVRADISKPVEVDMLFGEAINAFRTVDILVNNAAVFHPTPFENISLDEWDEIFNTNLRGLFYCTSKAYKIMKENRYGKIVNMSSIAGIGFSNHAGGSHYVATKAGIIGLTKQLAKEAAPYGVNVNVICPGPTNTHIMDYLGEEKRKFIVSKIPMGRMGEPYEVAQLVAFLCSDLASYITGAVISINGGIQAVYP